jgi:hypothetical protein
MGGSTSRGLRSASPIEQSWPWSSASVGGRRLEDDDHDDDEDKDDDDGHGGDDDVLMVALSSEGEVVSLPLLVELRMRRAGTVRQML